MAADGAKVAAVEITREDIDYGHPEIAAALAEIVPGRDGFRLPLAKEKLRVELTGVPSAVPNALRRVIKDELRGRCLTFAREGFRREASTDPFMSDDDFVLTRVRMIPLRPQVSEGVVRDLRLALSAENTTDTTMVVYSGDLVVVEGTLSEALFNPTHELAFLQPGRTLSIDGIRIVEGFGNQDAAFTVAVRGVSRPLDLEEVPTSETHSAAGAAVQQSGFVESSLVANPRRHEVVAYIPAVPVGGTATAVVLVDACGVIMERLRYIQGVLESARGSEAPTHRAANAYFTVSSDGARFKGILGVRNETDTIGNLLARSVYELMPEIAYVGYTCVPHEKIMKLTVAHTVAEPGDIQPIVLQAVVHAHGIFSTIQREIRAKTA